MFLHSVFRLCMISNREHKVDEPPSVEFVGCRTPSTPHKESWTYAITGRTMRRGGEVICCVIMSIREDLVLETMRAYTYSSQLVIRANQSLHTFHSNTIMGRIPLRENHRNQNEVEDRRQAPLHKQTVYHIRGSLLRDGRQRVRRFGDD